MLPTYLLENLFLKALIVFAIMGAISAKQEEKKNKQKSTLKQRLQTRKQEVIQSCSPGQ